MSIEKTVRCVTEVDGLKIIAESASEWDNLFRKYDGWTGADGIYSIPLSGCEIPGRTDGTKTLFVFSDTFVGDVDRETMARKDFTMVNNTLGLLEDGQPIAEKMKFIWGKNGDGSNSPVFIPTTENAKGKKCWYWLQDGICLENNVYILPMLVEENPDGNEGFKFRAIGVSMIRIPVGENGLVLDHHTQTDAPLFYVDGKRNLLFGAGIMPNTAGSGAPDPDGYIYIYGRDHVDEIKLIVARVKAEDFGDFDEWRFWDGTGWSDNITATAQLGRGGPELSVTPLRGSLKGKYLMTSMHVERDLYIRIGESPTGPFGERVNIYHTKEPANGQAIYTYNAKAHPSLSEPDEMLISYNVNSTNWRHLINNADIYRPRFLRMRFVVS